MPYGAMTSSALAYRWKSLMSSFSMGKIRDVHLAPGDFLYLYHLSILTASTVKDVGVEKYLLVAAYPVQPDEHSFHEAHNLKHLHDPFVIPMWEWEGESHYLNCDVEEDGLFLHQLQPTV